MRQAPAALLDLGHVKARGNGRLGHPRLRTVLIVVVFLRSVLKGVQEEVLQCE